MTGNGREHPSWDEIRRYLDGVSPSLHVIDGTPGVVIVTEPAKPRLAVRVEGTGPPDLDPLTEVEVSARTHDGRPVVELATQNSALFPYFFAFALRLADRVQMDDERPADAIRDAIANWRLLLQQVTLLSNERALGLLGELWLLRRLEETVGARALDAWTGPRGEAHDFRLGEHEIEVKSTRGERRVHTINGIQQLAPSEGMRLHLLSVQFTAAGAADGHSLSDAISVARTSFTKYNLADEFDGMIRAATGLAPGQEQNYRERVKLRSKPVLIAVEDGFPRITQADLDAIDRPGMERISDVRFRLDATGLGNPDGTSEFLAVIPSSPDD